MKVIDRLADFVASKHNVVTIGTFDGVHLGHQEILSQVVDEARAHGGKSTLITFWPHPRFILQPEDNQLKLLNTFEEKAKWVEEMGVDYILRLQFTEVFSNQSPEEFVQSILLDTVHTSSLYIGYDHRFGRDRVGDINFLQQNSEKFGFAVKEISRKDVDDIGISSTKIREALKSGQVALAHSLLGRPYCLKGEVVTGAQKGRAIGFPTANLQVPEDYKLLPKDGVYAVRVTSRENEFLGMLNIGFKPTVEGKTRSIEVHIFQFNESIYGESIEVHFMDFIREERKFGSLNSLKEQLKIDKQEALKILG